MPMAYMSICHLGLALDGNLVKRECFVRPHYKLQVNTVSPFGANRASCMQFNNHT